jgi:membrane-associated phospholipid phosphatase
MTTDSAVTSVTRPENSGNAGISGELGGGWFIEDGGKPFVDDDVDEADKKRGAKSRSGSLGSKRLNRNSFGERTWSARWWASLALHEFIPTDWRKKTHPRMTELWKKIDNNTTNSEIDELTGAAKDRASAMGEILSQDVEFNTDFMALLAITPGSHPNTYRVLLIANLIGFYAALYYKGFFNRPRPSQLCPALLPPIPMPGHASWPSGHATQAQLKALCMEHVLDGPLKKDALGAVSSNLRALARRVARNREIAGLHYPSDSVAGRELAETIFQHLIDMKRDSLPPWAFLPDKEPITLFSRTVTAAQAEWRDGPAAH